MDAPSTAASLLPTAPVEWWDAAGYAVRCPFCSNIHRHGHESQRTRRYHPTDARISHCHRSLSSPAWREYRVVFPFHQQPPGRIAFEIDKPNRRFVRVDDSSASSSSLPLPPPPRPSLIGRLRRGHGLPSVDALVSGHNGLVERTVNGCDMSADVSTLVHSSSLGYADPARTLARLLGPGPDHHPALLLLAYAVMRHFFLVDEVAPPSLQAASDVFIAVALANLTSPEPASEADYAQAKAHLDHQTKTTGGAALRSLYLARPPTDTTLHQLSLEIRGPPCADCVDFVRRVEDAFDLKVHLTCSSS